MTIHNRKMFNICRLKMYPYLTLFFIFIILITSTITAQSTISGTITNHDGEILDHIHVQLKSEGGTTLHDEGYTDQAGFYSFELPTGYADAMYRVKMLAENGYALVHAPGLTSTPRSFWGEFTFNGTETRDIQIFAGEADDGDGFWLAGEVFMIAQWFNSVSGLTVAQAKVDYPTDAGNQKAYYLSSNIHIGRDVKSAIYHEYGHFLHDEYASWISIPYYGGDGGVLGHYACGEQDCIVWPYFEGFAHLVGALSYIDIYGSINAISPYANGSRQNWIENPASLVGQQYVDDDGVVTYTCGNDYMNNPLYTESAVGAVLYDLVDAVDDGEIANIPFSTLWAVVAYYSNNNYHNPCINPEDKDHPITLIHFWDTYRLLNTGPVPYLWSAFANNYLDWDATPPNKPTITSSTHTEGIWTTDTHIEIEIQDGDDDVSGVYFYEIVFDTDPSTIVFPVTAPSDTVAINTTYNLVYDRTSGAYYLHVRGQDLSEKWDNSTTTFGPIQIDVENPYFSSYYPDGGQTYLISEDIEITWEARDEHSGVASVDLNYIDQQNGINLNIASGLENHGTLLWGIDNSILPTNTGFIEFIATDSVGNKSQFDATGFIEIRAILEMIDDSLEVGPGDLAWADFDKDGFDDLAYTGKNYAGFITGIKTSDGTSLIHHQTLDPLDEGSVAWGDFNRDGLIDLFTMGLNALGTTEAHFYFQDNLNVFNDQGSLGVPGMMLGDVKVADMDSDGDLDLIALGRWVGANVNLFFKGFEWNDAANQFNAHDLSTQGLFVGELLIIDHDGDGDNDIIYAGQNGGGTHSVGQLINNGNWNFTPDNIPLPLFNNPKMDAADFNNDGMPDIAITGSSVGIPSPGVVLVNQGNGSWATEINVQIGLRGGDLTFVDIDNDGDMDLTVVGRSLAGLATEFWINRDAGCDLHDLLPVIPYDKASIAWGDINGDHDLDLVIIGEPAAGVSTMTQYYNLSTPLWPNPSPNVPENLHAGYYSATGEFELKWNPPSAAIDKTPRQSFTYDIKIGTTSGANDIFSGEMPVMNGNTGYGTRHILKFDHIQFYWTVRTVDGGWERSNWATVLMADTNAVPTNVNEEAIIPTDFVLYQNYPNPFNPCTTIKYALPGKVYVDLRVYNLTGEEMTAIVTKEQSAGVYEVSFNAVGLASGVYFYKLKAGNFIDSKKMVYIK